MPGIFGFIKKDGCNLDGNFILESMAKPMRHMAWYSEEKIVTNDFGFGVLSVGKQKRIFEINRGEKRYIILIDGYIYSVQGRPISNINGCSETLINSIWQIIQKDDDQAYQSLEGNYTIAVFDISYGELTIFNDIIAPRRFYYGDFKDYFVFSSEMKGISFLPNFNAKLNWKGIADFLNYGYVLGEDTLFSNILSLPSSSKLTFDQKKNSYNIHKYWMPIYNQANMTFEVAVEKTFDLLQNSVREKIHPDSTVICPISGGLDSRIILGLLKKIEPGLIIKANTYAQKFSNEYKYAKQVCETLHVKNHQLIEIMPQNLLDKHQKAVWFSEGMAPLTNALLLMIPETYKDRDALYVNGIYGGPTNYHAEYYAQRHLVNEYIGRNKIFDIQKIISLGKNAYDQIANDQILKTIKFYSFESINKEFARHENASNLFCNQRDAFFIENRMRRLICQSDLMRFFWEEQLPLSNYELYKHYLQVPAEYKLEKRILKQMLKDKFEKLAQIKDANTDLNLFETPSRIYKFKKEISLKVRWHLNKVSKGKILLYDKSTYSHYVQWFQKNNTMFEMWQKALMSEKMNALGLTDPQKIPGAMEYTRKTGLGFYALARLTTLAIWSDMFLN